MSTRLVLLSINAAILYTLSLAIRENQRAEILAYFIQNGYMPIILLTTYGIMILSYALTVKDCLTTPETEHQDSALTNSVGMSIFYLGLALSLLLVLCGDVFMKINMDQLV
ncbi:hypothetical protein NEDG_01426 [Nematocida displodere]|uniref:Uncharacterized protein n=1 Tax=Nematocida displodere TaxID=1805483 RepID=A0A177EBM5_9MICR|nr:hypothetical protein NEDG_01426 [Nematocida displodere]